MGLEAFSLILGQDRLQQLTYRVFGERLLVRERDKLAAHAYLRRRCDAEMKIRRIKSGHLTEEMYELSHKR